MIAPMLLWLVSVSRFSRVTPPWSKAFTFDRGMWTTVVPYPTRFRIHLWHVMPCNKETWNSTANSTSCEVNKAHHIICFTSIFTAGEGYPYSISGGYAWCLVPSNPGLTWPSRNCHSILEPRPLQKPVMPGTIPGSKVQVPVVICWFQWYQDMWKQQR